ncbi:MAG: radical SAM protein [Thermosynechococcaceae cyanobacterium]
MPYFPDYTTVEKVRRNVAIAKTIFGALKVVGRSRLTKKTLPFGASVEITDRCNAGCNYCYVYSKEWDQRQRIEGYLQLSPTEHKQKDQDVYKTLDSLCEQGMVLVTLVGGEPVLSSRIIQYAAQKFPVVWVVSNGSVKFPQTPHSVVYSVSIDGPPDYHNQIRDPLGFFSKARYKNLTGMAAVVARNINESARGAYAHITLTHQSLELFPDAIAWLVKDIAKLRGILVSGAATKSVDDPNTLTVLDRQTMKSMIASAAHQYGSSLFPFNQPTINRFLFDEPHIIKNPEQCSVARRVTSLDFKGQSVGKCVLRDETACETCICNLTGLMRGVAIADRPSLLGLYQSCFG